MRANLWRGEARQAGPQHPQGYDAGETEEELLPAAIELCEQAVGAVGVAPLLFVQRHRCNGERWCGGEGVEVKDGGRDKGREGKGRSCKGWAISRAAAAAAAALREMAIVEFGLVCRVETGNFDKCTDKMMTLHARCNGYEDAVPMADGGCDDDGDDGDDGLVSQSRLGMG